MGTFLSGLLVFLPELFKLIGECQDENANVTADRLRNPGPAAVIKMARMHRQRQGWTRREWRQQRAETIMQIRQECAALSDADCQAILEEWAEDQQGGDA